MASLLDQVRAAQLKRGWSVQELLEKSGLTIDRSSLQRKLSGAVPTTTDECEALARALEVRLVLPATKAS